MIGCKVLFIRTALRADKCGWCGTRGGADAQLSRGKGTKSLPSTPTRVLSGLTSVSFPNSWSTTTVVTLTQVYDTIIDASAFVNVASGHGWVVYSWNFVQGGSDSPFPSDYAIVGFFILTNGVSPNGYVTAYYDIQNGEVSLSTPRVTSTLSVVCSATPTG